VAIGGNSIKYFVWLPPCRHTYLWLVYNYSMLVVKLTTNQTNKIFATALGIALWYMDIFGYSPVVMSCLIVIAPAILLPLRGITPKVILNKVVSTGNRFMGLGKIWDNA
jgi:hypothetical protein